ncbi:MAG: aspartate dehydrogenase [Candidatus Omnitrophota bacterium]|jgi:aspartate dehydrogenase
MTKKKRIGIVGCGAIGTSLAKVITRDFTTQAELTSLYDIDKNKARGLVRKLKTKALLSPRLDYLIKRSDLVIEAASAKSSLFIAKKALNKGRDIMIMSVGGVVTHIHQLSRMAKRKQAKVYIPSGAICGIDALKAAAQKEIKKIILTTRKHPRSLSNIDYVRKKGIRLDRITQDRVLFSGNALQAMRFFPQNINVAGVLSLAGIGQARTQVKIIASPSIKRNIHQVYIESDAGKIITRVENIVHPDNPKTSFLAVLSAVAMLRQILQPVRVGT